MKVYIGGGTGFVGRNILRALVKKGHSFVVISRTDGLNKITWLKLNQEGLPEDCDALINLAGENLMNPMKRWNNDFKQKLEASRIDTTSFLADLVKKAKVKPKVWVSSSAIGYYPPDEKTVYDEYSAGGKGDYLAELCQKWEDSAKTDPSVRHATVRLGIVLGRDGGTIHRMYLPFYFGLGGRIASGKQWFPWIHVSDAAGLFVHAIENENVSGVLNAVAPQAITNEEFTKSFAKAMWRPAAIPLPETAMKLVFGTERAAAMTRGQNVYPKRTLESGYQFQYPDIDSACAEFSKLLPWLYK